MIPLQRESRAPAIPCLLHSHGSVVQVSQVNPDSSHIGVLLEGLDVQFLGRLVFHRFLESDMVVTAKHMSGQRSSKMMYDIKENSAIPFYHVGCETEETDEFEREQEYIDYTGNECQEGYGSGQYFTIESVLSKKIKITDELADFIGHERGKEIPRHVINTEINKYLRDNGVDDKLQKLIGTEGKSSSEFNSNGATTALKKLLR